MVDRDAETAELLAHIRAGQAFRLLAPRRYGKTSLLARALDVADGEGYATALIDLQGVVSLEAIVVRIEREHDRRLKGTIRRHVARLLNSWNLGVSLGAGGFAATVQRNPNVNVEAVLLRLLDLPVQLHRRTGAPSAIVFDEVQDLLRVPGAAGMLRSVIQHQAHAAVYGFAGSAPALMRRLFDEPTEPLLEHGVALQLGPLPSGPTAEFIQRRFVATEREIDAALDLLIGFARGHPQRTMLLAHHLWRATAPGEIAQEEQWFEALDAALAASEPALAARWESWPLNEQRLALAIAISDLSLYDARTYGPVGLKRGSITDALAGLRGRGEAIQDEGRIMLTDPLLDHWLRERGV